jgi:hypothetical protein
MTTVYEVFDEQAGCCGQGDSMGLFSTRQKAQSFIDKVKQIEEDESEYTINEIELDETDSHEAINFWGARAELQHNKVYNHNGEPRLDWLGYAFRGANSKIIDSPKKLIGKIHVTWTNGGILGYIDVVSYVSQKHAYNLVLHLFGEYHKMRADGVSESEIKEKLENWGKYETLRSI